MNKFKNKKKVVLEAREFFPAFIWFNSKENSAKPLGETSICFHSCLH